MKTFLSFSSAFPLGRAWWASIPHGTARILLATAWLAGACARPTTPPESRAPAPDPERIRADIAWLADDAREGRGLGTLGLSQALDYVAEGFRSAGLVPVGEDGSYVQAFETTVSIAIEEAKLAINGEPLVRGRDFEAFLASASGDVSGELAFVGYGISDPESGWDDYEGIDAAGRVVVVLDDRPREPGVPLAGPEGVRFLRRAYKIANAREHGAAAILLAPSSDAEGLPGDAGNEDANPTRQEAGILALALSRAAAERLISAAGTTSLGERQRILDSGGRPAPEILDDVRVASTVQLARRRQETGNVLAMRPGADPELSHEVVVVGAHVDHLGHGEFGSLAPDRRGEVHNGADDNASGSAGLLALARLLTEQPAPRRSILLIAFTGEEAGLVGSSHYVANAPIPVSQTVAMLNLDMIGRLRDGRLTVFGAESSPAFEQLVVGAARGLPVEVDFAEGAFGPSDQTSFHAQGIPVLFFFTGTHPEYHTPDDDDALVNPEGTATVASVVDRVALALANAPERPQVVQVEAAGLPGTERGYGPYLGTVPAFGGEPVRGMRIQAVRPGSPAENAGLRGGDVIVEFAGASVANLEEFAALLFSSRAGERVEIVVERNGERLRSNAILGQRR
jgi:hypothetical protein